MACDSQGFIATLLFDPSMSVPPIIANELVTNLSVYDFLAL